MTKNNPENERIKRRYFAYLKEAKGYSESTIDGVAKALQRFESHTRFRDFKAFHIEHATTFKKALGDERGVRSGRPLSKATLASTLGALKAFFIWLAGQPGFKSRIAYADAEYFNPSEKDRMVARASREKRVPTLAQIHRVLETMPAGTPIERRDRALIAFAILTGARDGALASLQLKHVDLVEDCVHQDARDVKTKFSKTFTTWFFPVGGQAREIVADWVAWLEREMLWGPDDPLFPATLVGNGEDNLFQAQGLARRNWSNAGPIRTVFKHAFEQAGLPYYNPHTFRDTLVRLGEDLCPNAAAFKAWSQNLGHEKVLTTLTSYGSLSSREQAEIIRSLGKKAEPDIGNVADMAATLAELLKQAKR
jgi:integrase